MERAVQLGVRLFKQRRPHGYWYRHLYWWRSAVTAVAAPALALALALAATTATAAATTVAIPATALADATIAATVAVAVTVSVVVVGDITTGIAITAVAVVAREAGLEAGEEGVARTGAIDAQRLAAAAELEDLFPRHRTPRRSGGGSSSSSSGGGGSGGSGRSGRSGRRSSRSSRSGRRGGRTGEEEAPVSVHGETVVDRDRHPRGRGGGRHEYRTSGSTGSSTSASSTLSSTTTSPTTVSGGGGGGSGGELHVVKPEGVAPGGEVRVHHEWGEAGAVEAGNTTQRPEKPARIQLALDGMGRAEEAGREGVDLGGPPPAGAEGGEVGGAEGGVAVEVGVLVRRSFGGGRFGGHVSLAA